jgi:hypothetical protein
MRLFYKGKDGGPDSPVTGYWLIEIKSLFSIVLLRFERGSRENYHTHAFNAWTWFIKGCLIEQRLDNQGKQLFSKYYVRSLFPKRTLRNNLHRVHAYKTSWCFSIRGPWAHIWKEYNPHSRKFTTLTNGRKIVK